MRWLLIVEVSAIVLGICALLILIAFYVRRRMLSSADGVFDCGLRSWTNDQPTNWMMGIARYEAEELLWCPVFSLRTEPKFRLSRSQVRIVDKRSLTEAEAAELYYDQLAVQILAGGTRMDLSMTPGSLTGLSSWLEAAPPGGATYTE